MKREDLLKIMQELNLYFDLPHRTEPHWDMILADAPHQIIIAHVYYDEDDKDIIGFDYAIPELSAGQLFVENRCFLGTHINRAAVDERKSKFAKHKYYGDMPKKLTVEYVKTKLQKVLDEYNKYKQIYPELEIHFISPFQNYKESGVFCPHWYWIYHWKDCDFKFWFFASHNLKWYEFLWHEGKIISEKVER